MCISWHAISLSHCTIHTWSCCHWSLYSKWLSAAYLRRVASDDLLFQKVLSNSHPHLQLYLREWCELAYSLSTPTQNKCLISKTIEHKKWHVQVRALYKTFINLKRLLLLRINDDDHYNHWLACRESWRHSYTQLSPWLLVPCSIFMKAL